MLVSGGTDRFINFYQNCAIEDAFFSTRYKCTTKITKQGVNSVVNAMCTIDHDKLLVG